MPNVKLLRPRSLHIAGLHFVKGHVRDDIPDNIARKLLSDPRFEVSGAALIAASQDKEIDDLVPEDDFEEAVDPTTLDPSLQIMLAADHLDPDVESNFDSMGLPSLAALSEAVGFEVTDEARASALKVPRSTIEAAEAAEAKKPTLKIAKKVEAPAADPTTDGAVTV